MEEKLRGFLSKEDPSDEELELFLQELLSNAGVIFNTAIRVMDMAYDHVEVAISFIEERLKDEAAISAELHKEILCAIRVMREFDGRLCWVQSRLRDNDKAFKAKLSEADKWERFAWKKILASAGTPASDA